VGRKKRAQTPNPSISRRRRSEAQKPTFSECPPPMWPIDSATRSRYVQRRKVAILAIQRPLGVPAESSDPVSSRWVACGGGSLSRSGDRIQLSRPAEFWPFACSVTRLGAFVAVFAGWRAENRGVSGVTDFVPSPPPPTPYRVGRQGAVRMAGRTDDVSALRIWQDRIRQEMKATAAAAGGEFHMNPHTRERTA
jgi:hypothetical protein